MTEQGKKSQIANLVEYIKVSTQIWSLGKKNLENVLILFVLMLYLYRKVWFYFL